jgi:hypothetical protein|nr:MAG TPA: hypothetical protein [Caudoviricetes sp.]
MAEYNKQYTPTLWKNYPLTDTSINAYRLNHLEGGVNENDNRLVALSEDKAEQTVVNKMVKTVTLNKATGVLTVTLLDGTKSTYDLDIEKVVANFDLNNNNDLVLTLADGTQKVVPLSKFVDTYTFKSSGTITFNTTGKEITAFIPDGSITLSKLEATVLSTIRQYMLDAQTAKGQAEQAAENARGYAIGGTGFEGVSAQHFANQAKRYAVITDEAPKDNAQYYAQDAAKSAEEARQAAGCDGTAASITATDVQGLVVAAGGNSNVQALINAVADQVINRLVAKSQIVNNGLCTEPGKYPLDAAYGKTLRDYIGRLQDSVNTINSDLGNIGTNLSDVSTELAATNTDLDPLKSNRVSHINSNVLNKVNIVLWDADTADTPFKAGNTNRGNGFCITYSSGEPYSCQLAMAVGDSHLFTRNSSPDGWSGWTTK